MNLITHSAGHKIFSPENSSSENSSSENPSPTSNAVTSNETTNEMPNQISSNTLPHDQQKPCLHLIDTSYLIFRSFYAIRARMTTPTQMPCNAVYGFARYLITYLSTHVRAHDVVVGAFEGDGETWRRKLDPQYKANRSEVDPDILPQFAMAERITRAMNINMVRCDSFEADDVIATYALLAKDAGYRVLIVSRDKDLMQLLNPGSVDIFDVFKEEIVSPDHVMKKFGVSPDKVADVQAIMGDSADNIKGIDGVGPKGAATIINKYGSLEKAIHAIATTKKHQRTVLEEKFYNQQEKALMAHKLVQLSSDAPVPPVDSLVRPYVIGDTLLECLREWDMSSLVKQVDKLHKKGSTFVSLIPDQSDSAVITSADSDVNNANSPEQSAPIPQPQPLTVRKVRDAQTMSVGDVTNWCQHAWEYGALALDYQQNDDANASPANNRSATANAPSAITLLRPDGEALWVTLPSLSSLPSLLTLSHDDPGASFALNDPPSNCVDVVLNLLGRKTLDVVGINVKPFLSWLCARHVPLPQYHDVAVMAYCYNSSLRDYTCAALWDHFHPTAADPHDTPFEAPADSISAVTRASRVWGLYRWLWPQLVERRVAGVYWQIEQPLISVLAMMEYNGIMVDHVMLKSLHQTFVAEGERYEQLAIAKAGVSFNVASTQEVAHILFTVMNLPTTSKTKKGKLSTNSEILSKLAKDGHAIAEDILNYRKFTKLASTFTRGLIEAASPQFQRVHTTFAQTGAQTGRLSSIKPNLQNIPIRTKEGQLIRHTFVAPKGCKLVVLDYAQIELRLVAQMAHVEDLIVAINQGVDIHTATAAAVFGLAMDEVDADKRRQAKAINFGIIYGISEFGLANSLSMPRGVVRDFIADYFGRFPQIKTYMETTIALCKEQGFVSTAFGRRIHLPAINNGVASVRQHAERQAINAPIQGTAADIIKLAMTAVNDRLANEDVCASMVLQVHDELIFQARASDAKRVEMIVAEVMVDAGKIPHPDGTIFQVPFAVNSFVVDSWGEAKG